MATTNTLSANAISRQLTRAGLVRSVRGIERGTCTHGFIALQTSPWKAEVCIRPQSREDLQDQTDRHEDALRRLGYATEQYRGTYTGAPLIIRVTRPADEQAAAR